MKEYLTKKKSASALSVELHNARQSHKSIEAFGNSIEDLMNNSTLAQSCGTMRMHKFWQNGLRDNDLRVIVKSRNHDKLKDAIRSAIDADTSRKISSSQAFHMRRGGTFNSR
ncbi:hypothetical protein HHI36_000333 [Cryptolaemus montrouzieri]|uniref:Uncharacterized protein n=1 Tax=Cryptolaemus montrouzieri TaxID=559131 RepID=A0ABD2P4C5_9CUCU